MGLNTVYLNNINFDDEKFDKDDPETVIHVRLKTWCNSYRQRKACKKDIKKKFNTCSKTSNKMVGLMHVRR